MTVVYQAQNAIEAHMLVGLLQQHGCASAQVEGDYLQGAVGELQTMGLVRIRVNDNEAEHARDVIAQWEQQQPEPDAEPPTSSASDLLTGLVVGFMAGVLVALILLHQ